VKTASEARTGHEVTDAQLIEKCLNGNQEAWEILIRKYQNLIYSVPIHYRFSAQDAADVFQSVCVILLKKLNTLRSAETLSSWLYVTTRRACWKMAKKKSVEVELEEGVGGSIESKGEELVLQHQVRVGMEQLSDKCRELLNALYYSEPPLSYDEITARLGIPGGSIGPTRARCLERLKKILD
jgi:RNA polymerase sigma factor (sigma-70 family)